MWELNDGAAPQAIDTGVPNVPVNALVLDSSGANPVLYAGTDSGVYRGTFAAGVWNWAPFGTGMPNVQVSDLQLQTYNRVQYLFAATHGRGAWDIRVSPVAKVGARVWNDQNDNGIQDSSEPGFAGVTVNLYTSSGTLVATTTTDSTNASHLSPARITDQSRKF